MRAICCCKCMQHSGNAADKSEQLIGGEEYTQVATHQFT